MGEQAAADAGLVGDDPGREPGLPHQPYGLGGSGDRSDEGGVAVVGDVVDQRPVAVEQDGGGPERPGGPQGCRGYVVVGVLS
ncbi:hypothetical protein GCM10020227_03310 [Streptomyces flavovirens]